MLGMSGGDILPKIKDESNGRFAPIGDRPMAEKALSVRVDVDVDAAVRALGAGRSQWLREVITKAAREELMSSLGKEKSCD